MNRALLWKEWREQRGVVAAGFGSAVLTPALLAAWVVGTTGAGDLWAAAETAALVNATIVWPLVAAIVGAATGGDELASGTLWFLMSRPVSRERIWLTKFLTGACALIVIVGSSFVLSSLFSSFAVAETLRFPFGSAPGISAAMPDSLLRVYAVGAVAIAYATASFFAAFVARAMAAAMLGLAATFGLSGMIAVIQRALAYQPTDVSGGEPFAVAAFGSATAIFLLAGLILYRARDGGVSGRSRRVAAAAGAGALLVVVCATALAGALTTRIDARRALTGVVASVPGVDAAVVMATRDDWAGARYFVLNTSGSFRPLTPRMSDAGELSPDGRWFAYVTGMGSAGWRGEGCRLRIAGVDGVADRELARFPLIRSGSGGCSTWNMGLGGMRFSPDSSRLAVIVDGSLFVIDTLTGDPPRRISAAGVTRDGPTPSHYSEARAAPRIVGWSSDGSNLLIRGRTFIATISADSGVVMRRIDFEEDVTLRVSRGRGALIPVVQGRPVGQTDAGDRISDQLFVLDADSGDLTEVVSAPPDSWFGAWAGTNEVFYLLGPDSEPDEKQERYRVLHRYDAATRVSEEIARFPGSAFFYMSPDEDAFLVMNWDPSINYEMRTWSVTVFRDGTPQSLHLPRGWMIDGWLGTDHLVVQREVRRGAHGKLVYELAIADFKEDLTLVARREY